MDVAHVGWLIWIVATVITFVLFFLIPRPEFPNKKIVREIVMEFEEDIPQEQKPEPIIHKETRSEPEEQYGSNHVVYEKTVAIIRAVAESLRNLPEGGLP